ncbi:proline--tRNA ligase [candidate division NPL-UPA2 bacterium Unc8]|uniref:Proline--tRNA ligase n=1 Tax=candidate division NPL-UPA2 bacterium Unc8 TaxID=1980939 RepID=A0A399FYD3_UNCN2|nr:Proline--tRNA ligase [Bacillota bacterium]RII01117.1 MAG: proline--tRNA ligase [candidate division NPL-UPA2 bacterium Unc8]
MRWERALIPTLKENPQEAEALSHQLMLRAGLARKIAAGLYAYLPLGIKVIRRVETIIRDEMEKYGAQELLMPILQPRELWEVSGRWNDQELGMLKLKNREGSEFVLAPTHEEIITGIVRGEARSYKDFPFNLYQIQTKFRDEMRPRFGMIRAREFIMKDAYSFDVGEEMARKSYADMRKAYINIFRRCGLNFRIVEADPGAMGGEKSEEFIAVAENGEDVLAACEACDYATGADAAKKCPDCGGRMAKIKGIEVGHIFNLGRKYSKALSAKFLDPNGKECLPFMGCYGIGITRTVAAIIEQNSDEKGIIWPLEVAPYSVVVLCLDREETTVAESEQLYQELGDKGIETLLDNRDERAGVKFNDADLIGIPIHLIISRKRISEQKVEMKRRRDQIKLLIPRPEATGEVIRLLKDLKERHRGTEAQRHKEHK